MLCRNHFENSEELEAIVPGSDIIKFKVKNLKWYPSESSGGKEVEVANRAKDIYSIKKEFDFPIGTLIRNKTFLRTSRK